MAPLHIDTDYLVARLLELLGTPSPSGYTDAVVRLVSAELERLGLEVELTRRGAIRARRRGAAARPARAVVAHLDTLGAQVKRLKENGRLELVPIGTWSARFAAGARCTLFSERGSYRGTILPLKASGHIFNEEVDSQPTGWPFVELRVDAWARSPGELEGLGVAVGDIVAIDPQPELLPEGFVVSRHLDDKAGVAVMLAALEALRREEVTTPVDSFWLFSIAEEVGVGASALLTPEIASMVAVDNGTVGPGQASEESGVTIAMADQTGPFDWHLTRKLVELCREHAIDCQKDVFRWYRSDSASAIEAGADVRTALVTFGLDSSHGWERAHLHALRSLAELLTAYLASPVEIARDASEMAPPEGFTRQPMREAPHPADPESPPPHR
ncbi:osmoprotectant NAGGN system M42 family peptidase [Geminicoccaceae bacterium 1502E]|nr:osmoprotectant NAGGN system M42 family peptidase [Geminicoccaceae bacterium 1502E]